MRLVLVLVLVLVAAPAPAEDARAPQEEKARSLVATLRRAEDETARRDLYALGAPSLVPLAQALGSEQDPAAWTRLAVSTTSRAGCSTGEVIGAWRRKSPSAKSAMTRRST